jgi:GNAT superfamily N-acetyltransferase
MIRNATQEDAEALVRMGAAWAEEAGMPARFGVEFCPQSFLTTCEALARTGIMLIAEHEGKPVGMLGAAFIPVLWNYKTLLAQETWWYVEPERRKGLGVALLKEYEERASAKGVSFSGIVHELGPRRQAVGRLYEAKGYAPAESVFFKRLAVH